MSILYKSCSHINQFFLENRINQLILQMAWVFDPTKPRIKKKTLTVALVQHGPLHGMTSSRCGAGRGCGGCWSALCRVLLTRHTTKSDLLCARVEAHNKDFLHTTIFDFPVVVLPLASLSHYPYDVSPFVLFKKYSSIIYFSNLFYYKDILSMVYLFIYYNNFFEKR